MSVLVITNEFDPTSDYVIRALDRIGTETFRCNTEKLCDGIDFSVSLTENGLSGNMYSSLRGINLSQVRSVYYRRPQPRNTSTGDASVDRFVSLETSIFARWLWVALEDKFWVSHPTAIRRADSKLNQLRIAPTLGFTIPETLISNDPEQVRSFFHHCEGDMICKVLATGAVRGNGDDVVSHIYTTRVTEDQLGDDSIRVAPCQYQRHVAKEVELRITVVGEEVYAAEIHSQESESTRDDWRRYDIPNTPHKIHKLPDIVKTRCLSLVRYYGLEFGAIDMIVTPEGEYVFIEINPNGQWAWIEDLTGLPIAKAIAKHLANER